MQSFKFRMPPARARDLTLIRNYPRRSSRVERRSASAFPRRTRTGSGLREGGGSRTDHRPVASALWCWRYRETRGRAGTAEERARNCVWDRLQIRVDVKQIFIGHLPVDRPWHHLENIVRGIRIVSCSQQVLKLFKRVSTIGQIVLEWIRREIGGDERAGWRDERDAPGEEIGGVHFPMPSGVRIHGIRRAGVTIVASALGIDDITTKPTASRFRS